MNQTHLHASEKRWHVKMIESQPDQFIWKRQTHSVLNLFDAETGGM